ncbi:FkbM family methyltransferase [Cellulomonas sp. PS-H5]|uniref:FkbM family methyltransferase n=1 Tax=Cellulomonas sp. PS-H5 TaxID=2820400 RepID=UPI001C4F3142|nr:FkbM family methyltransferase [Cellulomonas sp. PS-H5]MBW0255534.1 FkbM family methyltransferase [Cellulomonas sp. PS-H5]
MPLNAEAVRTHLRARAWDRTDGPSAPGTGRPDVLADVSASLDPGMLFVLGLYEVALGRRPDPQGFRDNVAVLRAGASEEMVRDAVLGSDEAQARRGADREPSVAELRMIGLELAVRGSEVEDGRQDRMERERRGVPLEVVALDLDPARPAPWQLVLATELLRWVPGAGPSDLEQAVIRVARREAPHAVLDAHLPGRHPLARWRRDRAARRALDYATLQLASRGGATVTRAVAAAAPAPRVAPATGIAPVGAAGRAAAADQGDLERRLRRLEARPDVRVITVGELLLGVPAGEWRLAAQLAHRGHPEPEVAEVVRAHVGPGCAFVDVGASIGLYTVEMARRVGPSGSVVAFEPAPVSAGVLRQNVELNGLGGSTVRVVEAAVADRVGTSPFAVHDDDSGRNSLFPGDDHDGLVEVEVTTLDRAIPEGARVDVVKLDAVGAEPAVLRGMERVVGENPQVVVLAELDDEQLRRAGSSTADFLAGASRLGWRHEVLGAGARGRATVRLVRPAENADA